MKRQTLIAFGQANIPDSILGKLASKSAGAVRGFCFHGKAYPERALVLLAGLRPTFTAGRTPYSHLRRTGPARF